MITIKLQPDGARRCGDCQACCKLLPMRETRKPANTRCEHQKWGVGCKIYPTRPLSCQTFFCRWLTNDDTADLNRPDRSHCVIDPMPDAVELIDEDTGTRQTQTVIQIWVDPKYPYAFREPRMRDYIERRGAEGLATLIRWSSRDGLTVFPAALVGQWTERGGRSEGERSIEDTWAAIKRGYPK